MKNEEFNYVYTAPNEDERREIEEIRSQYDPKQIPIETGLEKLRRLNRFVNAPPRILAIVLGIAATLVFGFGITLILEWSKLIWGSVIGSGGIALMVANVFIYRVFLAARKKKFGAEILSLSKELLHETDK